MSDDDIVVVSAHAHLVNPPPMVETLRKIESFARVSHASEGLMTDNSWERFIQAIVVQHGDWSVVEHVSVSAYFLVDRGITHELVRHRMASFTQSSTRFINYGKRQARFIRPPFKDEWSGADGQSAEQLWREQVTAAYCVYRKLLAMGAPPQIARSVLPNSLASEIVVTANLRAWRHILVMRTTAETHPQMREVMEPLLAEFQRYYPPLFCDIVPGARQAEQMKLVR